MNMSDIAWKYAHDIRIAVNAIEENSQEVVTGIVEQAIAEALQRAALEPPKAREGWMTKHPATGEQVEVVTREDYDWLTQWSKS